MNWDEAFAQEMQRIQSLIALAVKQENSKELDFLKNCLILTQRACSLYLASYSIQEIYQHLTVEFPELLEQTNLFEPYRLNNPNRYQSNIGVNSLLHINNYDDYGKVG